MRTRWAVSFAAVLAVVGTCEAADHSVEPIISHVHRAPVASSGVAAVGYSKRLHALEIEFRDGLIYRYVDVPANVYEEFIAAESKARFYNLKVKGKYHCLRVRPGTW
jgi:hypothetical protein